MKPSIKTKNKRCKFCSKQFNRRRYGKRLEDYGRWTRRKYCSKRCANFRKELGSRSGYCWRARQHRKGKCEYCPNTQALDTHHKDGDITNNSPENLLTLCKSCHMKLHWRLWKQGLFYGAHTRQYIRKRQNWT